MLLVDLLISRLLFTQNVAILLTFPRTQVLLNQYNLRDLYLLIHGLLDLHTSFKGGASHIYRAHHTLTL